MAAFGIVLVLIAIVGGAALTTATWQSDSMLTLSGSGFSVTVPVFVVFASGAATILLAWLGTRLMIAGVRRKRAQRQQLRSQQQQLDGARAGADSGAATPARDVPPPPR